MNIITESTLESPLALKNQLESVLGRATPKRAALRKE
jgi:hypothetical protein